ncbi:MAG: DNA translocase FtsK [Candidatus Dojkabacteria bacterium]|nr:DNA translocase FtsK [Candidatus Dojkabacteria bacterium]
MPRKKKAENITIQSKETKIIVGIIIFILGLAVAVSSFMPLSSPLFSQVTLLLGYSSIAWGILLIYVSFFLLTKSSKFKSWKVALGLFFFSSCLSILLTFWQVEEQLNNTESLRSSGGQLGKLMHLGLNNVFDDILEIIIVLILLVIAFSLITGTTLEQIRDFLESSTEKGGEKKKFDILSLFSKKKSPDILEGEPEIDDGGDNVDGQGDLFSENKDEEPVMVGGNEENIATENTEAVPHTEGVADENKEPERPKYTNWVFPSTDILQEIENIEQDRELYKEKAKTIEATLKSFGIPAHVVAISVGPTVLRFSLSITTGIKVSKVRNLSNDLALALASQTSSVRVEAPIPGTSFVGVEIPNPTPNFVYIKDMIKRLRHEVSKGKNYELPLILGKDIAGKTAIGDLSKIPHLLVAGATGTGKSVAINSLISGILMSKTPDEVKFIMIDPKMGVEMAAYNGIPHLLYPVITDKELVVNALQWTIGEMMKRYRMLKQAHAKKLTEYNKKMGYTAMPYIVVVVDEMADLMLTAGVDVETRIQRLAQMGRAVGVHLILATQRPTVKVITGLIKANVPGRMAFAVATAMDSRVILDETGAETLLGNGDMLFKDQTTPKSLRIQGTLTTTEDGEAIINSVKEQVKGQDIEYSQELSEAIERGGSAKPEESSGVKRDPDFGRALEIIIANKQASASFLQRKMEIGYNKAARLIDQLYEAGAIGEMDGVKPRKVLVSSASQILGKKEGDGNAP